MGVNHVAVAADLRVLFLQAAEATFNRHHQVTARDNMDRKNFWNAFREMIVCVLRSWHDTGRLLDYSV